jgi:SAM-dependent methyltransferase
MSKKTQQITQGGGAWFSNSAPLWRDRLSQVVTRFNREYRGEVLEVPEEMETMPIFQELVAGTLHSKTASPFWELAKPQKNHRVLDIGCGVSFLVYAWREWEALFYGLDISEVAQLALNTRGPQLNSKLFKGVELGAAHNLTYEPAFFDLAIATGFSCYYPLDYWKLVLGEVKRVLKPGSSFVFDVLNQEKPLAEDWAILETYRGSEVFLESLQDWETLIKDSGAKILKRKEGELFLLYKVRW